MAAATYPAEPDATKALDYQGVIVLAQPDRVYGDPVSGHARIMGVLIDPSFRVGAVDWYGEPKSGPLVNVCLDEVHGDLLLSPAKARRLVKGLQRELDRLAPLPPQ